jgi:hypothetical protein
MHVVLTNLAALGCFGVYLATVGVPLMHPHCAEVHSGVCCHLSEQPATAPVHAVMSVSRGCTECLNVCLKPPQTAFTACMPADQPVIQEWTPQSQLVHDTPFQETFARNTLVTLSEQHL